jgi:hypothetical protein
MFLFKWNGCGPRLGKAVLGYAEHGQFCDIRVVEFALFHDASEGVPLPFGPVCGPLQDRFKDRGLRRKSGHGV